MLWLKEHRDKNPENLCLDGLSFGEVYSLVLPLAKALQVSLVNVNRVALVSENSQAMALTLYALFLLKKEVLLINGHLTSTEIAEQMSQCEASFLLTSRRMITQKGLDCVNFMRNTSSHHQENSLSLSCFEDVLSQTSEKIVTTEEFDWSFDKEQIAVIMNTSATSGKFKSVPIRWGQILAHVQASAKALGVTNNDNWLILLPLFHISGLSILLRSLYNGTQVTIMEKFEEEKLLALLSTEKINMISLVPTLLTRFVDKLENHTLRLILLGGEFIAQALVDKCKQKNLPLCKTYGMTEHCSQITSFSIFEFPNKISSVGKALDGVEIRIKNKDKEGVGEVWIKSPMLLKNYLGKENIGEDFNTDDIGYLDTDGFLFLLNRRKDIIISGGENIYPKEIEDLLYSHAKIQECAVVPLVDEKWGQVPVLCVTTTLNEDEIFNFLSSRLAKYKLPKQIIFYKELPRNATGKIQRQKLMEDICK